MSFERNWKSRGAALAEHHREMIRRTGKTNFGVWVWTPEEDAAIRKLHPDLAAIKKRLQRRSYIAIRQRVVKLGFGKPPNKCWTANEVRKLHLRWRDATKQELLAEFPRHSWSSMTSKANKLRIYRRRRQLKPTGQPLLDEIRNRATELRISLGDLDRLCSSGRFFSQSSQGSMPSRNILPRAIAALGGRIEIIWL